jgi:hypothetical protein
MLPRLRVAGASTLMCAVECCAFLCTECRNALAKAEGDAEAHRMRCASLETQLAEWKRAGLESDRRAHEAEAALERFVGAVAAAERDALVDLDARVSTLEGMLCP